MQIKNTNIKQKTIIMFSIVLFFFILGFYYTTYLTIFKNIDQIEKNEAKKTANRLFHALDKEFLHLETTVRDYAVWDRSYDFIASRDSSFIKENLAADVMENLQIDYMAFNNNNIETIYERNCNFSQNDVSKLTDSIKLVIQQKLGQYPDSANSFSINGLLKNGSSKFPVMVSIYRVFKNNQVGESNGTLVFAKIFNQEALNKIGEDIQDSLSFDFDPNSVARNLRTGDSVVISENSGNYSMSLNIRDLNKHNAAVIQLKINSIVQSESKKNSLFIVLLFLIGGIIIVILISVFVQRVLTRRLKELSLTLKRIGEEHDFNIRVPEIQDDDFYQLSKSFNFMLDKLDSAEKESAERTGLIKDILNNADQGFLVFGADCLVRSAYSMQCVKFFKTYPDDLPFPPLLYPDNKEQQEFLYKIISKIINSDNSNKREIYLSLLPTNLDLYERNISLKYKLLDNIKTDQNLMMMVIITDCSNQKLIESTVEKERRILKMVVKVVVDYNDFMSLIGEYRHFVLFQIFEMLRDNKNSSTVKATEIIRQIHTFKGNFGQFDMFGIYNKLNNLETEYFAQIETFKNSEAFTLLNFLSRFNMLEWLDDEMKILKETLGDNYFSHKHRYWITKEKIDYIENQILAYLPVYKYRSILPELKRIMFNPFKEMFNYHLNYINYLSSSQNKPLKKVQIEGGDFLADTILYNPLVKSLVHIFRNCIDHGIETQEERLSAGKDEFGEIKIILSTQEHHLKIQISDDGRGIDLEKVKSKAIKQQLVDKNIADYLPDDEILNFIFRPEFSTADVISDLSGRGMGLSAVKKEIEKINGSIQVETQKGAGTKFRFILPNEDENEKTYKFTIFDVMNQLIKELKKLITDFLEIGIDTENTINLHKTPQLILNRYSAVINVFGVVKGSFVISADDDLAKLITEYFLGSDHELSKKPKYIESSLAEFSNLVVGNTIKEFSDFEKKLNFNSPHTIVSDKTVIKYLDSQVWNCDIATDGGLININLVVPNKS